MSRRAATWRSVLTTAFAATLVVVGLDLAIQRITPLAPQSEVEDAVAALRRADPDVLVLGSSHARTWEVVGPEIERRTAGERTLAAVPVEFGKLTVYDWVLEHRLLPLFDDLDADGRPVRPSLTDVVLVTEWWDSVDPGEPPANLPSRAWTWRQFARDVMAHGLGAYNRNWLTQRWLRITRGSALVQDRGHGRIVADAKQIIRPADPAAIRASYDWRVRKWQRMVEEGAEGVCDPAQMAALVHMLDSLAERDLAVTIVLYPRKPATITARAKETTLATYASAVRAIAEPRGIPVHDWSTDAPVTDEDFRDDFDHITAQGNRELTRWMLEGDLSWLLRPERPRNLTTAESGISLPASDARGDS